MIISVPLFVVLPRKTMQDKKVIINLNNYRNWNFIVNNIIKKKYKEQLENVLAPLKLKTPIKLTFKLYRASNRITDRANVLSIHEKFFCDALTEWNCIEDDSDEYIQETKYITGGLDKENPRVEIIIEETK